MMPNPKPKIWRSEKYRNWLKQKDCCSCLWPAPSEPHHLKTRGSGGGDQYCIPVCRTCHTLFDNYYNKNDYWYVALKYIGEYLYETKFNVEAKRETGK